MCSSRPDMLGCGLEHLCGPHSTRRQTEERQRNGGGGGVGSGGTPRLLRNKPSVFPSLLVLLLPGHGIRQMLNVCVCVWLWGGGEHN